MITQPMALGSRLLLAVMVLLSGCQLESFSERQARQRADYLGEATSSQKPLVWTSSSSADADGAMASLLAAHLYGGQARISGEPTTQTKAILQRCEQSAPQPTSELNGSAIGLVGTHHGNQVVAIIDHHASGSGSCVLARGSPVHQVHWYRTFLVQNIDLPNG